MIDILLGDIVAIDVSSFFKFGLFYYTLGIRNHQDLYYEEEDSDFETLGIPSDEETRHINEVPLQKGAKKGNRSNLAGMTHKPKLPPKPKWNPAMDLSQLNNGDENLHKKSRTLDKKGMTSSTPAVVVVSGEKPSMPKRLSLQPKKMQKDISIYNSPSEEPLTLTTSTDQSSLLNNSYQPSSLSDLKFSDDSIPSTPDAAKIKDGELKSFADVAEDRNVGTETPKANSTSHSDNSTKEDEEMFKSLSIDSGEHDGTISDGENEVIAPDDIVELPEGDEETAKGKSNSTGIFASYGHM